MVSGSYWGMGEPTSNSSRVHYIHLRANTLWISAMGKIEGQTGSYSLGWQPFYKKKNSGFKSPVTFSTPPLGKDSKKITSKTIPPRREEARCNLDIPVAKGSGKPLHYSAFECQHEPQLWDSGGGVTRAAVR